MTKKMPNLFAKAPPAKPLTTLDAIVDDWEFRFGSNGISKHMRDEVVEHCELSTDFVQAVNRACDSFRPNGKLHNHQSRVPLSTRRMFRDRILNDDRVAEIISEMKNFDEIYDALESLAPVGIGPVTIYDVATRIAAYLKIEPDSLYLHAGVRIGWHRLYGRRSPNVKRIPKQLLPTPLQRIPCDQVEDMLCAYREYLKPELL